MSAGCKQEYSASYQTTSQNSALERSLRCYARSKGYSSALFYRHVRISLIPVYPRKLRLAPTQHNEIPCRAFFSPHGINLNDGVA